MSTTIATETTTINNVNSNERQVVSKIVGPWNTLLKKNKHYLV
jgi:hypothetical protein